MSATSLYFQWSSWGMGNLQDMHRSKHTKAILGRICGLFSRRSNNLLDLGTEVSGGKIRSQHYAGSRTVPINRIKGSEGRSGDFDREFNPTQTRTVDRWISIAVARSLGDALPLVELIQLGDDYYVRDGHHRISVARAFGEEYVDAKVIVMELESLSTSLVNRTRKKELRSYLPTLVQILFAWKGETNNEY